MNIQIPDVVFNDEELQNTPGRYSRFLTEWLEDSGKFKFTTFPNEGYDQMIVVKDVEGYSMCSHHLLPFHYKAHIGYIPNDRICGLSKIPRVVEMFAHRPQLQERLTEQVADYLMEKLDAKGVIVVLSAEHLCMSMRGVKKPGHQTVTSSLKGVFKTDQSAKAEFMTLIKG